MAEYGCHSEEFGDQEGRKEECTAAAALYLINEGWRVGKDTIPLWLKPKGMWPQMKI